MSFGSTIVIIDMFPISGLFGSSMLELLSHNTAKRFCIDVTGMLLGINRQKLQFTPYVGLIPKISLHLVV